MASGLAAMKQRKKEREEAANRVKADWFKATPEGVKVRFLQEIDDASPNYNEEQGLAVFAVERQHPVDFKKRAVCTLEEEGQCYPEEWHRELQRVGKYPDGTEYKGGWKQKTNFYISALVERNGEKKVEILQRNFNNSFVDDLIEIAEDEGTITEKTYIIKKRGEGTSTTWSLKEARDGELDVTGVKAYDLDKVALRHIPYDQQPSFFGMPANASSPVATKVEDTPSLSSSNDEW